MSIYIGTRIFATPFESLVPAQTSAQFERLKADIAEHGIQTAIVVDEDDAVIDGHHRLRAAQELGLSEAPIEIREGLTQAEKEAMAVRLNTQRRQLNREQRQRMARDLRERGWHQKEIAAALGIDVSTVSRDIGFASATRLEALHAEMSAIAGAISQIRQKLNGAESLFLAVSEDIPEQICDLADSLVAVRDAARQVSDMDATFVSSIEQGCSAETLEAIGPDLRRLRESLREASSIANSLERDLNRGKRRRKR